MQVNCVILFSFYSLAFEGLICMGTLDYNSELLQYQDSVALCDNM